MNKQYTEEQLKAALVRALPEKLMQDLCGIFWKEINGNAPERVTPHEWPAIIGMVEDGLKEPNLYVDALHYAGCVTEYQKTTAKWPVRAQVLADIGAITIDK